MRQGNGRRYAGQSAAERDALRRSRLMEATRELVGTYGYAATTIERICSTANVSTRHFYLQYGNKEAAFIDLYDNVTNQSFQNVLASLAETAGKPITERIPAAFMAYLGPMFDDLRVARIAFVEVMGVSPHLERKRLDYRESLIALVESEGTAAVARGEISDRDFRFATLALVGSANTIVYDWTIREDRQPAAELKQKLSELAVRLIAG